MHPQLSTPKTFPALGAGGFACALAPLLAISLGLTGCSWLEGNTVTIKEPPYIEAPPVEQAAPLPDPETLMFADIATLDENSGAHPELKTAVQTAVNHGVLQPSSSSSRFKPDDAATYGDFRTWTNAYFMAKTSLDVPAAGMTSDPNFNPDGPKKLPELTPLQTPAGQMPAGDSTSSASGGATLPTGSSMGPESGNASYLPESIHWGSHILKASQPINRADLAALYVTLSNQSARAEGMSPMEADRTRPMGIGADGALKEFKDITVLPDWSRNYVAIAYEDNIFNQVFKLAPQALTDTTGLQPARTVTRGEALVFLNRFFQLPLEKPAPSLEVFGAQVGRMMMPAPPPSAPDKAPVKVGSAKMPAGGKTVDPAAHAMPRNAKVNTPR